MKINIGDIVVLKSGGPKMTATGFIDAKHSKIEVDSINVVWMDKVGVLHRDYFDINLLDICSDAEKVELDFDNA